MKPINIKISAFGPFAGEVFIDFDKFGSNNIVLISGDTGSGKTTIFDAITYALYAKTSGDVRDASMLRSDFAKEDTTTFVELTFKYRGDIYTVKRIPKQFRKKKRGEGFTERASEVVLKKNGDLLASATKEVDKKIEEIIGISYEQYKQIAMIAQGDFIKLIQADTDVRSKIFRKLFNTKLYEELENNLKAKKSALDSEYSTKKAQIDHYKNSATKVNGNAVVCEDGSVLDGIEQIKKYTAYLASSCNILQSQYDTSVTRIIQLNKDITYGKALNDRIYSLRKHQEDLKKLKEQKGGYEDLASKVLLSEKSKECYDLFLEKENIRKENESLEQQCALSTNKLKVVNAEIGMLKETLEQVEEETKQIPELMLKVNELVSEKEHLCSIEEKTKKLSFTQKTLHSVIEEIGEKETELAVKNKQLIEFQAKEIQEVDVLHKANELKEFKKRIDTDESLLKELEEAQQLIMKKEAKKDKLHHHILNRQEEVTKKNVVYEKALLRFIESSAYNLAITLEEGESCPVCGSKEHPDKCVQSDGEVSVEDLNKVKHDLDEVRDEYKNLRNEHKSTEEEIVRLEETIDSVKEKIHYADLVDAQRKYLEEEKELGFYKKKQEEIAKAIMSLTKDVEKLKETIARKKEEKIALETKAKTASKHLEELKKKSSGKTLEEIDLLKDECSIKIKKINKKHDNVKGEFSLKNEEREILIRKTESLSAAIKTNEKSYERIDDAFNTKRKTYQLKEDYVNNILDNRLLDRTKDELKRYDETVLKVTSIVSEFQDVAMQELVNIAFLEEQLQKEETKKRKINNASERYKRARSRNNNVLEEIKKLQREFITIEEKYTLYKDLADVFGGHLTGKDRLSLERYVQQIYFDDIIERANRRFIKMSDSRYELIRKASGHKGSKQIGLDLDVLDNYTNAIRDVKTLSGGESFKASLCLALGLSDIIKEYSGGIKIDTMFIDEGFGTLDEESLDRAINILGDLSQNDIFIGIISHVKELRNRIDKKIIVEKSTNGSSVSTII